MDRIRVVTDSTAELSPEEIASLGIEVIPLDTILDGVAYRDRVTVSEQRFLELMDASPNQPMTSLPPVGATKAVYDRLGADGARVVSVHLSGELSGTLNAARVAAQLSETDVAVVDSRFIARAHGFQVLEAARLAAAGGVTVADVVAALDSVRARTVQVLGVSQLRQLIKGGRISKVQGALGGLVDLKILLRMDDGRLVLDSTALGMKGFEKHLHRILQKVGWERDRIEAVGFTHTGLQPYTVALLDAVKERFPGVPLHVSYASASIASHAGVGAVSLQLLERG